MFNRESYIKKVEPFIGKSIIKIFSGIRRSGKSTLMKLLMDHLKANRAIPSENILYINKESMNFSFIKKSEDLHHYVTNYFKGKTGSFFLFIDEVQMIEQWQMAVNSFLSDQVADIYISGSNSSLLSSELATLLSGRYIEIPVYTLTFDEFCYFSGDKDKKLLFKQFLKYGGFPGIHQMEMQDEIIYQYISAIFDSILLKDIVLRNGIRNVNLLEKIIYFVFDNIGNVFSAKKVVHFLKKEFRSVSMETIYNYLRYLEQPFILYKAKRYDLKGKKYLETNEKYFLADIGIRNAVLGFREGDISALLENIVFLELKKRGYRVYIGMLDNQEIDFIIEKENAKAYIQVAYLLESEKTVEREFGVLLKIRDNYPKYVLSMDEYWGQDFHGIQRLNIMDFLLNETLPLTVVNRT